MLELRKRGDGFIQPAGKGRLAVRVLFANTGEGRAALAHHAVERSEQLMLLGVAEGVDQCAQAGRIGPAAAQEHPYRAAAAHLPAGKAEPPAVLRRVRQQVEQQL